MNIWLAISLILAVITFYMLALEIFSVAFKLTGLSTSKIKFQVASLFTSTGFTTAESELIMSDDRRRKIAKACMFTGHIFSVAFMGLIINVFFSLITLVSTERVTPTFTEWYFIVLYVTSALFLVMLILKIPPINRRFQKFLETVAINSSKHTRNTNYLTVIDLQGKHAIAEVILNKIPQFAIDHPLSEMGLTKNYSINILSVKRGKRIVDVTKDTMFRKGDILIIYGLINDIKEVFINSLNNEAVKEVEHYNEITLINNYGSNALVEVYVDEVPKELENIKMKDAHLNDRFNINVPIIKRDEQYIFVDKDTIIQKGDKLTLFGPYKIIKMLFKNDDKEKAE